MHSQDAQAAVGCFEFLFLTFSCNDAGGNQKNLYRSYIIYVTSSQVLDNLSHVVNRSCKKACKAFVMVSGFLSQMSYSTKKMQIE